MFILYILFVYRIVIYEFIKELLFYFMYLWDVVLFIEVVFCLLIFFYVIVDDYKEEVKVCF